MRSSVTRLLTERLAVVRDHPLARGLLWLGVPYLGAGPVVDLIRQRQAGSGVWHTGRRGLLVRDWSLDNAQTTDLAFNSGSPAWSVGAVFRLSALPGAGQFPTIFGRQTYVSEVNNAGWGLDCTSSDSSPANRFRFDCFTNNGVGNYALIGSTTATAGEHSLVGTSQGLSGVRNIYLNGVSDHSPWSFNRNPDVTTGNLLNLSSGVQAPTYLTAAWLRELTPAEIFWFAKDPFSLLQSISRVSYFIPPAPTLTGGVALTPNAGALTLDGSQPTVSASASVSLTPGAGALSLVGSQPLAGGVALVPGTGILTFTGTLVVLGRTATLTPGSGQLTLTGIAPSMALSGSVSLTPVGGQIALAGGQPIMPGFRTPGAGAVGLTGQTPTVNQQGGPVKVGALVLTGQTPGIARGLITTVGTGSLVLTGQDPGRRLGKPALDLTWLLEGRPTPVVLSLSWVLGTAQTETPVIPALSLNWELQRPPALALTWLLVTPTFVDAHQGDRQFPRARVTLQYMVRE